MEADQKNTSRDIGAIGGFAAGLYMAAAYLTGIIIFIAVLKYPQITSASEKVRIAVEMKNMVFTTNILMYVLFGPVLVLFIQGLASRLTNPESPVVKFSAVTGYIWAGSLAAAGMISNAALEPLQRLFVSDPGKAEFFWQTIETVTAGIGYGDGELLGGLMTFGFGLALLKDSRFGRASGILGIVAGFIGIASLVPALSGLTAVFGLLQLAWFVAVGISLLNTRSA